MSSASAAPASRRRLLVWLGASGAAGLAALFTRDTARAGHDGTSTLHLGEENTAPPGSPTVVEADVETHAFTVLHTHTDDTVAAIRGVNASPVFGFGVVGESGSGGGVQGTGTGDAGGVFGQSQNGAGVGGLSDNGPGVSGTSFASVGVHGQAENPNQPAVLGESWTAVERDGELGAGIGVLGRSGTGTGLRGECENGFGLVVVGKAGFSTAGSAAVPAGESSVFVANPAVTADSHIAVTLVSDPGARTVRWVERSPGAGFTVHLTGKTAQGASLTYSIVEPVA